MKKSITHILKGREKHITAEETVLQPLPHKDFRFANPFIVLHHQLPKEIKAGSTVRIHPHPHRGFAPVTFMLQGEGYHKDNAGHDEIISAGDVQWMFAGKGLLHSEGPSQKILQDGGVNEFIQLWINVPAAEKWGEPTYQSARAADMPQVMRQEGILFKLASGTFDGKTGPIRTMTPITTMIGTIQKGHRVQLSAEAGFWTLLYVINGKVNINLETVESQHLVVFEKENTDIIICADDTAQLLFLSAMPINEPVAAKDNFVMNTPAEIEQAMEDYAAGVFGTLNY